VPPQQPPDLGELPLPADERGERRREVARPGVERPGREEVRRQPLDHQVVQVDREVQVFQPVLPEVTKGRPFREGVLDQAPGGAGHDDLPAVGRPGDPRRPVHLDANVVVAAQHPFAGVQAYADPYGEARGPVVGGQAPLGGHRGRDRRHRAGEGGEEGVALGADLDAVLVPDRPAQERRVLVADRRVGVAQLLEQPGRASMSVNRNVTVPVGSGGAAAGPAAAGACPACRRRRSSRPVPSSIAATPSRATTTHRMPAGESSALPDPTHSAAATATAIAPLSRVVAIRPGLPARSDAAGRRPACSSGLNIPRRFPPMGDGPVPPGA
jgi:hypothetical protein